MWTKNGCNFSAVLVITQERAYVTGLLAANHAMDAMPGDGGRRVSVLQTEPDEPQVGDHFDFFRCQPPAEAQTLPATSVNRPPLHPKAKGCRASPDILSFFVETHSLYRYLGMMHRSCGVSLPKLVLFFCFVTWDNQARIVVLRIGHIPCMSCYAKDHLKARRMPTGDQHGRVHGQMAYSRLYVLLWPFLSSFCGTDLVSKPALFLRLHHAVTHPQNCIIFPFVNGFDAACILSF